MAARGVGRGDGEGHGDGDRDRQNVDREAERTRFDGPGFILFGAAMVLITIAMEGLGELHLPHLRVMLLLFADATIEHRRYQGDVYAGLFFN